MCLSSEHLGLFWPYLPHLNSESHRFFSWTPYSSGKTLSKFHNFSHPARPFPKVLVYAECMVASPNSEHSGLFWSYLPHPISESCTVFFHRLLILQEKLWQTFIIFLNRLDQSPKFQFWQNAWEQVRIRSTEACFGHISLIRPRNCAQFFFMDSLFFRKPSVKIS